MRLFLRAISSGELIAQNKQTSFLRVFQSGTYLTAESTEAMQITCLAQGHRLLMQPLFEPLISVSINRYLNRMANMVKKVHIKKQYIFNISSVHDNP